jgi:magnesium-transporting ATPase (P-type)
METNTENRKLELDQESTRNLDATRKWAMFLAILGFIVVGFILITGLVAGTFFSVFKSDEVGLGIPESLMVLLFVIIAAIYFLPVFFLFRFSRETAKALKSSGQEEMRKAFRNLRAYFTYIGILAIIIISIYIAALLIAGTTVAFLKP